MTTPTQLEFDYPRLEQLAMIREIDFRPLMKRDGMEEVSAANMKAVFTWIDSFSGRGRDCYATSATMAAAINVSVKTVQRAIRNLKLLGVITCDRRLNPYGTTSNHYRIVWTDLKLFIDQQKAASVVKMTADQSDSTGRPSGQSVPTKRTVRADQVDSLSLPNGQLGPTNRTVLSTNVLLSEENPPPLSATCESGGGDFDFHSENNDWSAVTDELLEAGVITAARTVNEAKSNRCSAEQVRSLIVYWKRIVAEWPSRFSNPAFALKLRIENHRPDKAIEDGWLGQPGSGPHAVAIPRKPNPIVDEQRFVIDVRRAAIADGKRGEELQRVVDAAVAAWRRKRDDVRDELRAIE
jgi:hypothetical protein